VFKETIFTPTRPRRTSGRESRPAITLCSEASVCTDFSATGAGVDIGARAGVGVGKGVDPAFVVACAEDKLLVRDDDRVNANVSAIKISESFVRSIISVILQDWRRSEKWQLNIAHDLG